jgi:hypothetical protein
VWLPVAVSVASEEGLARLDWEWEALPEALTVGGGALLGLLRGESVAAEAEGEPLLSPLAEGLALSLALREAEVVTLGLALAWGLALGLPVALALPLAVLAAEGEPEREGWAV